MRVAIVGSGPSGLYAAAHLLENRDLLVEIDLFEKLPTPWGLVRGGVAPDHPEKKLIIDRLFDFWLKDPRVRFFGNVEIGSDIRHEELTAWYSAVIYAKGAEGDAKMGIPGEQLAGSWSAREFVAFYNGHPDCSVLPFDLGVSRAVIVGNGNVALDVARMLTMDVKELARTDISDHALAMLRRSNIREVVILGRRGPLQAAYNNPELEKCWHLGNVNFAVEGVDHGQFYVAAGANADPIVRRKMDTLHRLVSRRQKSGNRRITFRFLRSPLEIQGNGKVERIVTACNNLQVDSARRQVLQNTGRVEPIEAGLVLWAIGYRGTAFPGLPFDNELGVIRNQRGRVSDGTKILPGVYTSGWIKRGCNGIIGSNKKCANETIHHLWEDFKRERLPAAKLDRSEIMGKVLKRAPRAISLTEWIAIDHAERAEGRATGSPLVKITSRSGLLDAAFPL
jgi:ferredoxin--NADP+ reductase